MVFKQCNLSKEIVENISSIEDVDNLQFGYGEHSLTGKIRRSLKKGYQNKWAKIYQRMWDKNEDDIQDQVRNLWRERNPEERTIKTSEFQTIEQHEEVECHAGGKREGERGDKERNEDAGRPQEMYNHGYLSPLRDDFLGSTDAQKNEVHTEVEHDSEMDLSNHNEIMRLQRNINELLGPEDNFGSAVGSTEISYRRTSSPNRNSCIDDICVPEKMIPDGSCSSDDDTDTWHDVETADDDDKDSHRYGSDVDNDKGSHHSGSDMEVVRPQRHHYLQANFCRTRGDFEISELNVIDLESHKLDKEKLRAFLVDAVPREVNVKCSLSFYGDRQNKNAMVMYAKCKYKECGQRFKFDVAHYAYMPISVFLYSTDTGSELHTNECKLHYQLRGTQRIKAQEKLEYMMPRQMQLEDIRKTDEELVMDGNMQRLRKLNVYQKARSEMNFKYDLQLQSRDLQDLMQLEVEDKKKSRPYLQHASNLNMTMFSEDVLRAVGPGKILRGDATGSCCRSPAGGEYKRILYYAFVVLIAGIVMPVLEFVTSEHNVLEIGICLSRFRYFVSSMDEGCWPYFNIVIVDWSWAFIHAIMLHWNDTDIYTYIRVTCNHVLNGNTLPRKWIILQNCAVHFLKRVSDKMEDVHKSYPGKNFVMDCMAFMVQCDSIERLDAVFDKTMQVLVTPCEDKATSFHDDLHAMSLKRFQTIVTEDDNNDAESERPTVGKTQKNEDSIYKGSPFYSRYLERLNRIKAQLLQSDNPRQKNNLQSLDIAHYIVDHYMPYATMWTGLLIKEADPESAHMHNQHVEAHFHTVKYTVLEERENLSIGNLFRRLQGYMQSLLKTIRFDKTNQTSLKAKPDFPQKQKLQNSLLIPRAKDPSVQEEWRKKPQKCKEKRRTHFQGHYLKRGDVNVSSHVPSNRCKRKRVNVIKHVSSKRRRCSDLEGEQFDVTYTNSPKRKRCDRPPTQNKRIKNVDSITQDEQSCRPRTWSDASSGILNQSDNSIHREALNNGLFDDVDYYEQDVSRDITVGRYTAEQHLVEPSEVKLLLSQFITLRTSDKKSVKDNTDKWIIGDVIDAFAHAHLDKWTNVSYIPTDSTYFMIGDNHNKDISIFTETAHSIRLFDEPFKDTVLLPYLKGQHWRLLVLKIAKTARNVKVYCIDPMKCRKSSNEVVKVLSEGEIAVQRIRQFASTCLEKSSLYKLSHYQWKLVEFKKPRPYQQDTFNCGVFVMYYMQSFGDGIPMEKNFCPTAFRRAVARSLLEKSRNMKDTCLYCFSTDASTFMVMCRYCRRYVHARCIPGNRKKQDEWNEPSEVFQCELCACSIRDWMKSS